jgi:hypothetical protein
MSNPMKQTSIIAALFAALATPSLGEEEEVIGTFKTPEHGVMYSTHIRGHDIKGQECIRVYMDKTTTFHRTLLFCPCEDQTERQDKDTIPVMCPVKGSEDKESIR